MYNQKNDDIYIRKRKRYCQIISIEEVGSLLEWKFSTKRKNIGFGIYYKPSKQIEKKLLYEQYKYVFDSLSAIDFNICPPPKNGYIIKGKNKIRHNPNHFYNTSHGSNPELEMKSSFSRHKILDHIYKSSSAKSNAPDTAKQDDLDENGSEIAPSSNIQYRKSFLSDSLVFQNESNGSEDYDLDSLIEVLPIQKYESYKFEVCGKLLIPLPGLYILVIDNSFSLKTRKHVFFSYRVRSMGSTNDKPIDEDSNTLDRIEGWILRQKRRTMKRWEKCWMVIREGMLCFFDEPNDVIKDSVFLNNCTITKVAKSMRMIVDSGEHIYHLKALNCEDYIKWMQAIAICRNDEQGDKVVNKEYYKEVKKLTSMIRTSLNHLSNVLTILVSSVENTSLSIEQHSNFIKILENTSNMLYTVMCESSKLVSVQVRSTNDSNNLSDGKNSVQKSLSHESPNENDVLSEIYYDANDIFLTDTSSEEYLEDDVAYTGDLANGTDISTDDGLLSIVNGNKDILIPLEVYGKRMGTLDSRTSLPHPMVPINVSVSSILYKSIGKDFSCISMPICLNEPLTILQRMCDEVQYDELLKAVCCLDDSMKRMALVAAFVVSGYSISYNRTKRKPLNPMLGETFEHVLEDRGFWFIAEKVSHDPQILACNLRGGVESNHEYEYSQDIRIKSRFWGKSIELIPYGNCYLKTSKYGDSFTWKKVISSMHNIIGKTPWIEHTGEVRIKNHANGEVCLLVFKKQKGIFYNSSENEVSGFLYNSDGKCIYNMKGRWNEAVYLTSVEYGENVPKTQLIWKARTCFSEENYGFGDFTMGLNELTEESSKTLPKTDSRFRPDMRYYEMGNVNDAENEKLRIEDIQRRRRKIVDTEENPWHPTWFCKTLNPLTKEDSWILDDSYWRLKDSGDLKEKDIPSLW